MDTSTNKIICFVCSAHFESNRNLVKHLRENHPAQNFYCCAQNENPSTGINCTRKFDSLNSFWKHRKLEHGIQQASSSDDHDYHDVGAENDGAESGRLITPSIESDFQAKLDNNIRQLLSTAYSFPNIPNNRVFGLTQIFSDNILGGTAFQLLKNSVITRLHSLNDSPDEIRKFSSMFDSMSQPFKNFKSQYLQLNSVQSERTFIDSVQYKIGERQDSVEDPSDGTVHGKPVSLTAEFIPLRKVLQRFFELPNILEETLKYVSTLMKQETVISNFVQGEFWREFIENYIGPTPILPLFLYFDEFEVNNPLGSHAGFGKVGAIYASLPCLPIEYQAKLENIFIVILFYAMDRKTTNDRLIFFKLIDELNFLEKEGIEINGTVTVRFKLCLILGDNLGIHSIFGSLESFSSNYFCRFCLVRKDEKDLIFSESQCTLRDIQNYVEALKKDNPKLTGIRVECVLHEIGNFHVTKNLCVDPLHEFTEGLCRSDVGRVLHIFTNEKKYFDISQLDSRINGFPFDPNDKRSKPPSIRLADKPPSLKLMFSASEMRCFIRILPILIADLIPKDEIFFRVIIKLKQLLEIVFAFKYHKNADKALAVHVEEYLKLLSSLGFSIKPKHHFTVHYASVMKKMGPLGQLSTMRHEGKHQTGKIIAHASRSRVNICRTIAKRHQQILQESWKKRGVVPYETGPLHHHSFCFEIENYFQFRECLPFDCEEDEIIRGGLSSTKYVSYLGKTIKPGKTILMKPSAESIGLLFLNVKHILLHPETGPLLIAIEVDAYYDEYVDSFVMEDDDNSWGKWWCVSLLEDLGNCFVTYHAQFHGKRYIIKKWE